MNFSIPLKKHKLNWFTLLLLFSFQTLLIGSSHREAPLIANDPLADNVDLYAFRSPDNTDMITIIATYVPLQLPHGGPNYYTFGENVRYEIHVDNDASVAGDEITYRFTFTQVNEDPTTFFNIRLGKQNLKTSYTLERSMDGGLTFETIITDGVVPPNNIGTRSIESGVGLNTTYDQLYQNAITDATTGERVFAGPTDDPFFVDLGGIFDLGDAPRQAGKPRDGLACLNVSAIAIQVPISSLKNAAAADQPESILDPNYVIGVWASASRPAMTTLTANGPTYSGDWVQVSRLGMPLTNEAVIPIGSKDFWNRISPYDEISETTLDEYFYNPELALYMDDDLFGGAVPALGPLRIQTNSLGAFDFSNGADGLFILKGDPALDGTALDDAVFGTLLLPAPGKPRSVDLWPTFHTGVPNVIPYQLATGKAGNPLAAGKPFINNFLPNGGDMLRLNMAVPPTQRDDAFFSSLGLIQAAAIGLTVAPFNTTADLEFIPNMDGFPNGRRLEDDVTRIELQAVSGAVLAAVGLWYDDYDPATSPSPVTQDLLNVLSFSTGVESNDVRFRSTFPYLALPHSGTSECSGQIFDPTGGVDDNAINNGSVFVSSNTSNNIGVYEVDQSGSILSNSFVNQAQDADGIYYDETTDVLFQLNRSKNVVDMYANVTANLAKNSAPDYVTSSTSDFINGREITVSGNKLIVAQDANDANGQTNRFIIYNITTSSITFDRAFDTDINLWGIDIDNTTLYAIQDNSANLAVFENFFGNSASMVSPTKLIEIQSMGRTHGLCYHPEIDAMLLTDIGEASSAEDGGFSLITDFTNAMSDNYLSDEEQVKIEGSMSSLGNPVDIAMDPSLGMIYVAERAKAGGQFLAFPFPMVDGDLAPVFAESFPGASAVNVSAVSNKMIDDISLFISSNLTGKIGIAGIQTDGGLSINQVDGAAIDADGIYYDGEADVLYQLNRSENVINAYSNVLANLASGNLPELTATSSSDFINGREIAVADNRMIVAQDANDDNGQTNKLYVYEFGPTYFELKKTYDVEINLWGIHAELNTLYAIVDNSNELAIFDDFFLNEDGAIQPDQIVSVDGIGRTHGLTYDAEQDLMLLSDIGEASSGDDGGIVIIENFSNSIDGDLVDQSEQVRISGPSTLLGNPVDLAYSKDLELIYVAERANAGGQVLVFPKSEISGDLMPIHRYPYSGASAVYLSGSTTDGVIFTDTDDPEKAEMDLNIFPNPSQDFIKISIDEFSATKGNLAIYDFNSNLIYSKTNFDINEKLDISQYTSGIYIMKLSKNDVTYQGKFLKM